MKNWQKQILKMTETEPVPALFKVKNTTKMKNETINKTEVLSFAYAMHKNFLDIAGENIENYQKTSIDETVMKKFYLDETQKYLHKGQAILKMIDYLNEQK